MMLKPHPLKGPNRFKIGVFSANADGGLAITDVPERWRARWDDVVTAAQIADRAGMEFFLPIARWRGFGGKNRVREHSFETFTFAAGLASATQQIGLFMTVHVPIVHPVYAAKALATVDHISGGRAGLNIVCGWNPDEFAMFGIQLAGDVGLPGQAVHLRLADDRQRADLAGELLKEAIVVIAQRGLRDGASVTSLLHQRAIVGNAVITRLLHMQLFQIAVDASVRATGGQHHIDAAFTGCGNRGFHRR